MEKRLKLVPSHIMRCIAVFLFFMAIGGRIQAQSSYPVGVSINRLYGFTIAHRPSMQHLSDRHYAIWDACYMIQTTGRKPWERAFGLPRWGVSLFATDFGGSTLFGTGLGAFVFLDRTLISYSRFRWSFLSGSGLGIVTRPFNTKDNYKNIAIGSSVNGIVRLETRLGVSITPNLHATIGLGLTHFSNGASRTPNLGINNASAQAGIAWWLASPKVNLPTDTAAPFTPSSHWMVWGFVGAKQNYPADGPVFPVGGFSLQRRWNTRESGGWLASLDFYYNGAMRAELLRDGDTALAHKFLGQMGVSGAYEVRMGKLRIPIFLGFYVWDPYRRNGIVYQGLGFRYELSKSWEVALLLKSHMARAEYLQWGLAYRW